MAGFVDLELSIRPYDEFNYQLEIRYSRPGNEVEPRRFGRLKLDERDLADLRELEMDPAAYGERLGQALWSDNEIRDGLTEAAALALDADEALPLRFRLYIDPTLHALHTLRWETLRHPRLGTMSTNEMIHFSRYLPSEDGRPVSLRPHTDLRALVFIANPDGLEAFGLEPVDVSTELERARSGLDELAVTEVVKPGEGNLTALMDAARKGVDILYIVAHGAFLKGKARLLLEEGESSTQATLVDGATIVEALQKLEERPNLIILASCQSAGSGATDPKEADKALAALGPALARTGIPAVLAMQGQVTMSTISSLMPAFFTQLFDGGQIDRALTVARSRIEHKHTDWWMPVLYMNLRSGRIGWYTPGFGDGDLKAGRVKWRALKTSLRTRECTPIVGIGLLERWFGSRRMMAGNWARKEGFPAAAISQNDLPQVAQYLAVTQSQDVPRIDFVDYIYDVIWERYADTLDEPPVRSEEPEGTDLNALMLAVWQKHIVDDVLDPYSTLAALKLPIYLTADPSDLLLCALKRNPECSPRVRLSPWNDPSRQANSSYEFEEDDPEWEPSEQEPLVYYLFGRLAVPETLVITEDEYFDYLFHMAQYRRDIPRYVTGALSKTALLVLGFRFDDWDFRTLFRILMNRGGKLATNKPHIAAQLEPNEQNILKPGAAREYLEDYYMRVASIDIFWGRTVDFLKEFQKHIGGRK